MGTPWKPQTDLFLKPILNLWEFSKPTIAQVHGYCVGGGTHFGLTTDIVIASEDAYFQYSPLQGFGMPSGECSIEPWVFMNWRRAAYYLYMSEVIDAQKALEVVWSTRWSRGRSLSARRGDRQPHRTGSTHDAAAHQGEPEAGMGADGDAGALAELQRSCGPRISQRGRAGLDGQVLKDKIKPAEMAGRQAAAAAASTDGAAAT